MRALVLLGILVYGLFLLALVTLQGAVLALAIPFVVYLASGLLAQPNQVRLEAARQLSSDRVMHGTPVIVTLTVTNAGPRLEEVRIEDPFPDTLQLIDGEARVLTSLEPGAAIELQYTVQGKRGFYNLPPVQAAAGDGLGLFVKHISVPAPAQLFVLPELLPLRQVNIRPRRTRVYSGTVPARQGGPGIEFFGVREYQPGDSMRWVNARATARHQQAIFVNEFEQERVADVGLILDTRRSSDVQTPDGSLFEYSIQATAALAEALLTRGNYVGFLMYGNGIQWTFPGYGKRQRERIMSALARARLGEGSAFEDLDLIPTRLFPARSQLIIVSPLLSSDLEGLIKLRARWYELLVVSPDPVSFERKGLKNSRSVELATRIARVERELLLRQLGQVGIHTAEWQVDAPFYQVAHAALGRASVWGRAVERQL